MTSFVYFVDLSCKTCVWLILEVFIKPLYVHCNLVGSMSNVI